MWTLPMIGLLLLLVSGLVLGWWTSHDEPKLDYRNLTSEVWSGDE